MAVRFPIKVEIALGADLTDPPSWSWTDITAYCYVREGGYSSARGRASWQTIAQPSNLTLLFNNSDGRFSRLNPVGAYYGQLNKNTPVRVSIDPGSGYVVRATGFVSDWPVQWNLAETDFWVNIRADGVLRRLQQGSTPLRSALTRAHTSGSAVTPIAYWPMEDGTSATSFVSGLLDGAALTFVGTPLPGSVESVAGSDPVASFGTSASFVAAALNNATAGELAVSAVMQGAMSSDPNPTIWVPWKVSFSGGTVTDMRVVAYAGYSGGAFTSTVGLDLQINGVGVITTFGTDVANLFDSPPRYITATAAQNGANVDLELWVDGQLIDSGASSTQTLGTPNLITGPLPASGTLDAITVDNTGTSFALGHLAVHDETSVASDLADAASGHVGELAGDRADRLCAEEGVPADVATGSTQEMGVQPVAALFALLRECEAAEAAVLIERRDGDLGFDPPSVRYNVDPVLELDYSTEHVFEPFLPVDDDRLTRNDVTARMPDGSWARIVDQTGPLGVDSVGRYDTDISVNVAELNQAYNHAGWQINLGTVNGYRYPSVTLQLHSSSLTSLLGDIVAVDVGSRITIANLPANMPPDLVDLVVEGINERADNFAWTIEFICSPYEPYRVAELAETSADASEWIGRLAGDEAAAIRTAIDADDTSIVVDPNRTRFTTVADDFDPDIQFRLGGEVVEVSSIATTAGTYVAAGAMSSADNAAVTPALYAGNTTGDLICVLARIRSASAGTLGTPTDYTRLRIKGLTPSSPMQLFAKVHDGSESNPTVTPSGGAAGDTVSAVTFGLRGTPSTLTDLTDIVVDSLGQANASAQNIAYPGLYPRMQEGCIILALGGKDDDWTSVAALSGFTEAVDTSTTTGNDQGLVVDYVIQTTPAVINEGSFTVTGGASAVSEGAVIAIAAGYQTFTVSARNVNGIPGGKSHAVGTRIGVEDSKVLAL